MEQTLSRGVDSLLNYGLGGVVLLFVGIGLVFFFRKLSAWADLFINEQRKHQSSLTAALIGMREDIREQSKQVRMLVEGNAGSLIENQVVNMVAVYSGKVHAELQLWWLNRLDTNGILTETDRVRKSYSDKLNLISSKMYSQMGQYRYKGLSLDRWLGEDTCVIFYGDVLKTLYDIQKAIALGSESIIAKSDINEWLDRHQSRLMGSARAWCKENGPDLKLWLEANDEKTNGNLEWLKN